MCSCKKKKKSKDLSEKIIEKQKESAGKKTKNTTLVS